MHQWFVLQVARRASVIKKRRFSKTRFDLAGLTNHIGEKKDSDASVMFLSDDHHPHPHRHAGTCKRLSTLCFHCSHQQPVLVITREQHFYIGIFFFSEKKRGFETKVASPIMTEFQMVEIHGAVSCFPNLLCTNFLSFSPLEVKGQAPVQVFVWKSRSDGKVKTTISFRSTG